MSYIVPDKDSVNIELSSYTVEDKDSIDFNLSTTVKVYDGTSWVEKPVKYYDGNSWVAVPSLNTFDGNSWNEV